MPVQGLEGPSERGLSSLLSERQEEGSSRRRPVPRAGHAPPAPRRLFAAAGPAQPGRVPLRPEPPVQHGVEVREPQPRGAGGPRFPVRSGLLSGFAGAGVCGGGGPRRLVEPRDLGQGGGRGKLRIWRAEASGLTKAALPRARRMVAVQGRFPTAQGHGRPEHALRPDGVSPDPRAARSARCPGRCRMPPPRPHGSRGLRLCLHPAASAEQVAVGNGAHVSPETVAPGDLETA